MKKLRELNNRVNSDADFQTKYPQFKMHDNKIHVLYISPCLNEAGYYRMILPALELNRTDTHCAIVGNIHKWDFTKLFDDYDSPVDFRLVAWADYVVIPAMFTDASYIINSMREINDKIDFVMDMELNYHDLPEYHPDYKKLSLELKAALLTNLSRVDILTAPNGQILNYYRELAEKSEDEFLLHFEHFPNLLSNFTFEEIKEVRRHKQPGVRVGLILDPSQVNDFKSIERPILSLMEKYKEKMELTIFGWTEKLALQNSLLEKIKVRYINPVSIEEFHERLNGLSLDFGLLPLLDNPFNTSGKSFTRFLDFSAFMVPVIVSNITPFTKRIVEGENGFIAHSEEEWVAKIELLLLNDDLRKDVGNNAFKTAWENFSYSTKAIQKLKNIFI